MNINWKVRVKNPAFWIGIVGVVMAPILAYNGMTYADLTTWSGLWGVLVGFASNPYLIGSVVCAVLGALGVAVDPTTTGLADSALAMTYETPKASEKRQKFDDSEWRD